MMKAKHISYLIACMLMLCCLNTQAQNAFPYPALPDTLRSVEQRATYLSEHYWDNYQFCPKYTGYKFEAFNKTYDFSGKTVTKQSKLIVELDPNYTYDRFNIWASFRYYGKQYANVGNSVYFNGRWETFAGASYKASKMLTFNVNVVNFLNQRGAQGTIPGSELITDGSQYAGTIMAGNYIRPFTVEFGAKLNF